MSLMGQTIYLNLIYSKTSKNVKKKKKNQRTESFERGLESLNEYMLIFFSNMLKKHYESELGALIYVKIRHSD